MPPKKERQTKAYLSTAGGSTIDSEVQQQIVELEKEVERLKAQRAHDVSTKNRSKPREEITRTTTPNLQVFLQSFKAEMLEVMRVQQKFLKKWVKQHVPNYKGNRELFNAKLEGHLAALPSCQFGKKKIDNDEICTSKSSQSSVTVSPDNSTARNSAFSVSTPKRGTLKITNEEDPANSRILVYQRIEDDLPEDQDFQQAN